MTLSLGSEDEGRPTKPVRAINEVKNLHDYPRSTAVVAIQNMTQSPDFDRKMLLMVVQLAHENQLKQVLLNVLRALLRTLTIESGVPNIIEGITLTRCDESPYQTLIKS